MINSREGIKGSLPGNALRLQVKVLEHRFEIPMQTAYFFSMPPLSMSAFVAASFSSSHFT